MKVAKYLKVAGAPAAASAPASRRSLRVGMSISMLKSIRKPNR